MVGRAAVPIEVLAELGWMTILFSGLEELLVDKIGEYSNPDDQEPGLVAGYLLRFNDKITTLDRLVETRCRQAHIDVSRPMSAALQKGTPF